MFLPSLQSKDHGPLLDLIVCGDQSSGKSSVLEAVSGVRFPTKDNLCTRFATELVLRRDSTITATVTIIPGAERSDEEKQKLRDFKAPTVQLDHFSGLIDAAKINMGLDSGAKAFTDDVLRVEISGPQQPHLTLVDLPGLIHAESKQQSTKDVQLVSSLVRGYMANTRSIILAVVSAKNDYANQIVTKFARDVDPKGLRTLGIITKPDTLHAGSESEKAFLDLAQNKDVVFRLGWHVLRNRDYDGRNWSVEERDEKERDFFSQGAWMSLPTRVLGIAALKPRLSTVLKDQIIAELPSLIDDVEAGINESRKTLMRLGEARGTLQEQRLYLVRSSQSFSSLIKAAVDGLYVHEFFGDAMTHVGFKKRLRAVVQDILLEFADDMRDKGHSQEIIYDDSKPENRSTPKQISRSDFLDNVRELMRRSRGCELPGTFNPSIIGDLFYQQSRPWKRLLEQYSKRILDATRTSLELVLTHTTDETTSEGLLREVINPAMARYTLELEKKVSEIMRPHQKGHPITYNQYFTETIQKARQEHAKREQALQLKDYFKIESDKGSSYIRPSQGFHTGDLLNAINERTHEDMNRYACSEAVDCMNAYYKVAMKVVVDNFSVLGIENCLLEGLSDTFSPDWVMKLEDSLVSRIAAETEDSQVERARAVKKLESLETGLQTLNQFSRNKVADRIDEAYDRSEMDNVIDDNVIEENVSDDNVVDDNVIDDEVMDGNGIEEPVTDDIVMDCNAIEEPVTVSEVPDPCEPVWSSPLPEAHASPEADHAWGFTRKGISKKKKAKGIWANVD
ncbi:MAG: hypothetical protein Q9217_004572 [Psora testacea]